MKQALYLDDGMEADMLHSFDDVKATVLIPTDSAYMEKSLLYTWVRTCNF